MIALYLLDKQNINEQELLKKKSNLSPKVKKKISKNKNCKNHWCIICSDLLIRTALSYELGINLDRIKIEIDLMGKPYLLHKERHFNLSHTDELIVLVTDDNPVGVDVERVRSFDEMQDIKNVFSSNERKKISTLSSKRQLEYFYDLWTLKESYLKAIGKGLSIALNTFDIAVSNNKAILSSAVDGDLNWNFKLYKILSNYKCAVCSRNKKFPSRLSQAFFVDSKIFFL